METCVFHFGSLGSGEAGEVRTAIRREDMCIADIPEGWCVTHALKGEQCIPCAHKRVL